MKPITISIIISVAMIVMAILFVSGDKNNLANDAPEKNNVNIVDGKQIIEIDAKGGYRPKFTIAKSEIPTIIKVNTKSTFDCSASLNIPSISFSQTLTPSGETLIDIPAQEPGFILDGICGMGMYNFQVKFE